MYGVQRVGTLLRARQFSVTPWWRVRYREANPRSVCDRLCPRSREEVFAIGVAREDSLAVVAALGEMEPVAGRGEAISAGQGGFGTSVY